MRNFGLFLIAAAVILGVYALQMDVSVAVGDGSRVNNIGLMADRQNYLLVAVAMLIAGVLASRRLTSPRRVELRKTPNHEVDEFELYKEDSGRYELKSEGIHGLALTLIDKHPNKSASEIMLVSLPKIDQLVKPLPKDLQKRLKSELEARIRENC